MGRLRIRVRSGASDSTILSLFEDLLLLLETFHNLNRSIWGDLKDEVVVGSVADVYWFTVVARIVCFEPLEGSVFVSLHQKGCEVASGEVSKVLFLHLIEAVTKVWVEIQKAIVRHIGKTASLTRFSYRISESKELHKFRDIFGLYLGWSSSGFLVFQVILCEEELL